VKKIEMRGGTKQIFKNSNRENSNRENSNRENSNRENSNRENSNRENSNRENSNRWLPKIEIETEGDLLDLSNFNYLDLVFDHRDKRNYLIDDESIGIRYSRKKQNNKKEFSFFFRNDITDDILQKFLEKHRKKIIKKFQELKIKNKIKIYINIPYIDDEKPGSKPTYDKIKYLEYEPEPEVPSEMLKYLNIALKNIGIGLCLTLFEEFLEKFDAILPIVSVGSGRAYFEFLISNKFEREITCVDPNPTQFQSPTNNSSYNLFIPPEFNNVDKLMLSSRSNCYKNCLLILNWPDPEPPQIGTEIDDIDKVKYDLDAIIKLKPMGFFIIYESGGISGSSKMLRLLNSYNNYRNTISFNEGLSYKLLETDEYSRNITHGVMEANYNFVVASYQRTEL
jgi:hypothetical protein